MNTQTKVLIREARKAISLRKFATAAAYLNGLPECSAVSSAREYLRQAMASRDEYAGMSSEEQAAHDNA